MRGDENTRGKGEWVKIPLLPNKVGKKERDNNNGHDSSHQIFVFMVQQAKWWACTTSHRFKYNFCVFGAASKMVEQLKTLASENKTLCIKFTWEAS